MQHFKPVISNDASLSISYCCITWISLAPKVDGDRCLSPLMYKAKAHSRCGQDIVGSETWEQQPQHSFSASGVIRGYHVYNMDTSEKATMVREPGNEHDQFAVVVLEDEMLCTVGHFFLVVPDLSLFTLLVVQC